MKNAIFSIRIMCSCDSKINPNAKISHFITCRVGTSVSLGILTI